MKVGDILCVFGPIIAFLFALLMMLATDTVDHCDNCPSSECLCIQDVDGNWMLSPEVGE